jgi:glycosyltransferase involved in cell wall biosynthesis
MLTRLLGGPPFSFTVHGPEEFDKPEALHLARKAHHARFVVAISSFGRSQLWRLLPAVQWPKVKVVHCGLDHTFTQAPANAEGLQTSTLVCVGRLCEQKGQLLLIPAIKALRDAGVEVRLVLAGDGEMRREVEAEIARCGLQAFVRITGWISSEQVRQEISAARALVLPSFAEGLPVVIMEALALGRPVVSTFVAGIPELVTEKIGWLVPAGDQEALVEALQDCLSAPLVRLQEMGAQGRARVLSRHDADVEAHKLATLFAEKAAEGAPA